ncbi:hypothetical protein G9A89_003916 [Geosiphon pyriformis]|nr:hypothetical protein G9A89_003916 [Geosiphon pyriformis]
MELAIPLISPAVQIIGDNLKINSVIGEKRLKTSSNSAFHRRSGTLISLVLGESNYVKSVSSLWRYGIAFTFKQWKRLDPCGLVPAWFELSIQFLNGVSFLPVCSTLLASNVSLDVFQSREFGIIGASLFDSDVGHLSVYTDGSLSDLGTVDMKAGAAVFVEDIGMGLSVGVSGLMSSTLTELKAIALALECILSSYSIDLFLDSQAALDACKLEIELVCPDFRNRCWIKRHHIVNIICCKNLKVNWCKVKGHLEVSDNKWADKLAKTAALSGWHLPHSVNKHYLRGGGAAISAGFRTYFMKALHHWLPVVVHKRLYNKHYPSVVCLFCGDVEVSDHAFFCLFDANGHARLLNTHAAVWGVHSDLAHSSSGVLWLLSTCVSNVSVSTALCKSFVFKDWFHESVSVFKDSRKASQNIVAFVHEFSLTFWEDIWLVCAKHHTFIEKNGLIPCNGSAPVPISGLSLRLSSGMTWLMGVAKIIGVGFGFCKSCLFFSGIGGEVSVHIDA